jgi:peptidoglycan-associated lipoprotein
MMKSWKILILFAFVVIAGCAGSEGTLTDDEFGADGAGGTDGSGVSAYGDDGAGGTSGVAIGGDGTSLVMNERIVYFAYDSSTLDDAAIDLLKQHGRYLADNPGERARLEGHTDERGSREYNIGLGERRAVSVQSVLLAQGAAQEQLTPVSFGEERPAEVGMTEAAYAQNRRVEIVYER